MTESGSGRAAGVHLPWARVPRVVQDWAADLVGEPPDAVRDLAGGFSPGAASILSWRSRAVFVKAVGPELNPESPSFHRREAVVTAALPSSRVFPHLIDTYDDGDWVALAFDAVEGRQPRCPWDPAEFDTVAGALAAMHEALTPSPAPELESLAVRAQTLFGGWASMVGSGPPAGLDAWACRHLDRLAQLESDWARACDGSTLVHGDVRADNVLMVGEAVVFVDWPHGAVGNPAFDVVSWAPSVSLEGGPVPEELLARYERDRALDDDAVTILLAAITGFFVSRSFQPSPPGLPTLRRFQSDQGAVALEWIRRRTGW
jgi:Ser/Thr protein kinase RdoA (MazF antagonist)